MEAMTAIVRLRANEAQQRPGEDLVPMSRKRALKLARVINFASQLRPKYLDSLLLTAETMWEHHYGQLMEGCPGPGGEIPIKLIADVIEALAFPEDSALEGPSNDEVA